MTIPKRKRTTCPSNPIREIVIYQTEDGQTQIDVRLENETVWFIQGQMVELFQTTKQNVSLHVGNEKGDSFKSSIGQIYQTF